VGRNHGFTLIELLITLGLIGVLASIALPQIMRARMNASEGASIAALRAISAGEASFAAGCGAGGYVTDLADLVRPAPDSENGFISPDLNANGVLKSGYIFSLEKSDNPDIVDILLPACNGAVSPRASGFFANAVPVAAGSTGTRFFATDTSGTIFISRTAPIPNPIPGGTEALQ
jgi:prepilin-type N-terminal cleavage/methylation domain-containing protein